MVHDTFYKINANKREKILKVIRDEFTEKTYDEVTIVGICKRGKLHRSAFYRYFSDLEACYEALIFNLKEKFEEKIKRLWNESGKDIFEALKLILVLCLSDDINYILIKNIDKSKYAKKLFDEIFTTFNMLGKEILSYKEEREQLIIEFLMKVIRMQLIEFKELKTKSEVIVTRYEAFVKLLKEGYVNAY